MEIQLGSKEISRIADDTAERQALTDALFTLRVLKQEALDFPEWERNSQAASW